MNKDKYYIRINYYYIMIEFMINIIRIGIVFIVAFIILISILHNLYNIMIDIYVCVVETFPKRSTCTICLDDVFNTPLPCGHVFHNKCIHTWLEHNKTCPNCRMELYV